MSAAAVIGFDPLKDVRHLACRAAPDLANWLAYLEGEDKADRTRSDYLYTAAEFTALIDKELEDYTSSDVLHYLRSKPTASRRIRRAHLNSLFGWARFVRRIDENPMEFVPKPRRPGQKVVDVFSDLEIEFMRTNPLLSLMLDTGIRKGECRRLRFRDITLEQKVLTVYNGKGSKDRQVPLTSAAVDAIKTLLMFEGGLEPSDYLWSSRPGGGTVIKRDTPISESAFQRWWVTALESANVSYRNAHTTRHTFATRLIRRGARLENVKLLMGHASIQTTMDLYGHLDIEDARLDLELLES